MKEILKYVYHVLFGIFSLVGSELTKLRFISRGHYNPDTQKYEDSISDQERMTDILEVFKPTRVFFLFNVVSFIIFVLLPQGKDVILLVVEDLSKFKFTSLLSLLVGVAGWAILAEFGARYKIYISDNSGKSLSGPRVCYRKQLQKFFSLWYLLMPYFVVLLSVIVVTLNNIAIQNWNIYILWPFAILMILLILSAKGLSVFYLDRSWINRFTSSSSWKGWSSFLKLPPEEAIWLNKLYGIYNDYIFTIRKESFYLKNSLEAKELYDAYAKYTAIAKTLPLERFPDEMILPQERAPYDFRPPVHYADEFEPDFTKTPYTYVSNEAGSYRWIYKNNPSFYKTLHKQIKVISISSALVFLLITLNWIITPAFLGAPGLVCVAFGCWQGLYTGLLYIDWRYKRRLPFSVRWFLFIWLLFVSFIDMDHPVRYNQYYLNDTRLNLDQHFGLWMAHHAADSVHSTHWSYKDSTQQGGKWVYDTGHVYPVIFVTAEGGALRTGAFTAMLLAALADKFPDFKNDIYAFSSVSGGSVGVSFFNAQNYLQMDSSMAYEKRYHRNATREFFSKDQLSPVLSKMFYGDILGNFWPQHFNNLDRAVALEKAWENDYDDLFHKATDDNTYSDDFMRTYTANPLAPIWFINTTEVESGLQCFVTNVKPDGFLFSSNRDLLENKIRGGINYSTAVNFSSRFPLVSPSGAIRQNDHRTFHYVDGGYVENTGSKTMLELLEVMRNNLRLHHIRPYILQLKFGTDTSFSSITFLNEIQSIFSGIYNTRAGNSDTYSVLLRKYVTDTLKGRFISVPLDASSSAVPMNWVLSEKSMDNLESAVESIMNNPRNELHRNLYFFNGDSAALDYRKFIHRDRSDCDTATTSSELPTVDTLGHKQ